MSIRFLVKLARPGLLMLSLLAAAGSAQAQSGLAGWWKFDEGTGTTTADASGNAHPGTLLASPTWSSGHTGPAALTFNGGTSEVTAAGSGSLANLYSGGLTVSAWINPTGQGGGGGGRIVDKDNNDSGWFFAMSGTTAVKFTSDQDTSGSGSRTSTASISLNTWQHVLVTWTGAAGGANMHIYINGVQADGATTTATGPEIDDSLTPLTIGNRQLDSVRGFAGAIDDVRIYNRVLTVAEIQALADSTAPAAPANLTATATSGTQISLSWTAATDNIAVTGYQVWRCAGVGCSNFSQLAAPTTSSYSDTGLTAGTSYSYRVLATDAAGNTGPFSNTATASTLTGADVTPPSAPASLTATAVSGSSISLSWPAATDNVGVTGYRLERCSGACSSFAPLASPTSSPYTDTGLSVGTTYTYRVRATDAAGNLGNYSPTASATTAAPSTGPVAWWKFDEGSGLATSDASGNSNTAILTNSPTWTAGRVGPFALTFNGTTSELTASGAGVLTNLYGTGFTVSAWIKPTAAGGGNLGRIVDRDNNDGGWFLAMNQANQVRLTSDSDTSGTTTRTSTSSITLNTWQHVVATWTGQAGGANMHVYINGTLADGASTDGTGPEEDDSGVPLTIGNRQVDKIRGFAGSLDDVRIYNRVLSASEIQALANLTAPTAPTGLNAPALSSSRVNLSWGPSTSTVGLLNYSLERCTGSGCNSFAEIGKIPPSRTVFFDGGVSPSTTYTYRVRAKDANNGFGDYSGVKAVTTPAEPAAPPCTTSGPPTACYTYDEVGRLTSVSHDDGARQSYVLDPAGNRVATKAVAATQVSKPTISSVTARSPSALDVSWSAPPGGTGIFTYVLSRGTTAGSLAVVSSATCTQGTNTATPPALSCTQVTDNGLSAQTTYYYSVVATDSEGNVSPASDAVPGTTFPPQTYPPPVISSFTATAAATNSMRLNWAATGGPNHDVQLLTYNVTNTTLGQAVPSCANLSKTTTTCVDSSVSAASLYSYRLDVSDPLSQVTHAPASSYTLPGTVIGLSVSNISTTGATVSWSTPGGTISGYQYSRDGGSTWSSTAATSVTFTDLMQGRSYTVLVRAQSPAGPGASSSIPFNTWYIETPVLVGASNSIGTQAGFWSGQLGSMTPATTANGLPYVELRDHYSPPQSGNFFLDSFFSVGGFMADPGAGWLISIQGPLGTRTPSNATYGYSNGVASWQWGTASGEFAANGTYTIVHR